MAVMTASPVHSSGSDSVQSQARASVIACVDDTRSALAVVRAAADFAQSFERPLILLHVLDHEAGNGRVPDPFEWNMRRLEVYREMDRLRSGLPDLQEEVRFELSEGDWITALADRDSASAALLVVGGAQTKATLRAMSGTARQLVENYPGSVLLVPRDYSPRDAGPNRIAVPIDGSNYAEAALVEAVRLARRHRAELLLIHAVPDAGLADFGPPMMTDLELRLAVDQRNERLACAFLESTRRRLLDQGLVVRSLCLKGEARTALLHALEAEACDLVVLSPKGQGGRRCNDLSVGSTASYLLDHLGGPILLVKSDKLPEQRRVPIVPKERMPSSAVAT